MRMDVKIYNFYICISLYVPLYIPSIRDTPNEPQNPNSRLKSVYFYTDLKSPHQHILQIEAKSLLLLMAAFSFSQKTLPGYKEASLHISNMLSFP